MGTQGQDQAAWGPAGLTGVSGIDGLGPAHAAAFVQMASLVAPLADQLRRQLLPSTSAEWGSVSTVGRVLWWPLGMQPAGNFADAAEAGAPGQPGVIGLPGAPSAPGVPGAPATVGTTALQEGAPIAGLPSGTQSPAAQLGAAPPAAVYWQPALRRAPAIPGTAVTPAALGAVPAVARAAAPPPLPDGFAALPARPESLPDDALARVIMRLPPAMAAQALAAGLGAGSPDPAAMLAGAPPFGAVTPANAPGALSPGVRAVAPFGPLAPLAPPPDVAGNAAGPAVGAEIVLAPPAFPVGAGPAAAAGRDAAMPGGEANAEALRALFGEDFVAAESGSAGDGSWAGSSVEGDFGGAESANHLAFSGNAGMMSASAAASGGPPIGAGALARAPLDRPAVQRELADEPGAANAASKKAQDLDHLADEVYRLLRWRLLAERERSLL
jgi:hypothetical protein